MSNAGNQTVSALDTVKTNISNAVTADVVSQSVVDALAKRKITTNTNLVIQGIDKLAQLEADLKKINKPDSKTYSAPDVPATEVYSQGRIDEIAKGKKAVKEVTDALELALTKADYSALEKLVK